MMKKEMRKKNRASSKEEALRLFREAEYGVLATVNAAGEPRTVAVNHFLLDDETLLFHSALEGEKIENIRENPNVSFFVVGKSDVVPEEFTTAYESAVAHGRAELIDDEGEKRATLKALTERFTTGVVSDEELEKHLARGLAVTAMVKVKIEILTGKTLTA